MRSKKLRIILISLVATLFFLLKVTASQNVQAANLADGTYTVPVELLKQGTTEASMAKKKGYINNQEATVVVSNGTYAVSLLCGNGGAKYIQKMTAEGVAVSSQTVNDTDTYENFTLTEQSNLVDMGFVIVVPGIGKEMPETAQLKMDWAKNQPISTPAPVPDKTAESSSSSSFSSEVDATATGPEDDDSQSSASAASDPTQTSLTYTVLQADSNQPSTADQYYTHQAAVTKNSDGSYKVTMVVSYAKSLGMGSKGVVPLTVAGKKVTDITYGSTDKNQTVTYSFNVDSLTDLDKVIDGTIHVTVPSMNISQNFEVRFKFAGAKSGADKPKTDSTKADSTSTTDSQTPDKSQSSNTASANKLPQTGERQSQLISVIGILTSLTFIGGLLYRRSAQK